MADEKCPSCGTPYEADATFCINCGAKRVVTPPPAQPAAPEPPKEAAPAAPPSPQSKTPAAPPPATAAPSPPSPAQPAETPPSDDAVLDRLDKKLAETRTEKTTPPPTQPAAPAAPATPPAQPAAAPAPPATPKPATPSPSPAPAPTGTPTPAAAPKSRSAGPEAKPKKSKGCCIFGAIAGIVGIIVAGILVILYATGVFGDLGMRTERQGYVADFTTVNQEDFDVLLQGKNAEVKGHEGMLKARNALVVARYDAGVNYKATCLLTIPQAEQPEGWAGICLRVNPKGAERYAFQVFPGTQEIRIAKIGGKGEPVVLKKGRVKTIAPGKVLTLGATAVGNDLTMELDGSQVFKTTDIGLMNGPVALEARGVTAYFDDLTITSL